MPMDSRQSDLAQARGESNSFDLALALDAARIGAWEWDPTTDVMNCSRRMRTICGISPDAVITFDLFLTHVRTEDRTRTQATLLQSFRDGGIRSVECRLTDSSAGTDRWIVLEGRACVVPAASRRMLGTARDISGRKVVDAQRDLASEEMQHRIRNVFQVVSALVALSERSASTPRQLAAALQARIAALARAHESLQEIGSGARQLSDLIEDELAPFVGLANTSMSGAQVTLGRRQAKAMSVILHELITNAIRHGALARPGGRLSVDWRVASASVSDCLVLRWREHCACPIAPPVSSGMGLKFLTTNARAGLRGDILLEFDSTGLLATVVAPICCLADTPQD